MGILDSQYGNLLNQEEQKKSQQGLLLNLALGLLSQSGPSTTPKNFGSILGTAGLGAIQNQNQTIQGLLQSKLFKSKLDEQEAEKKRNQGLLGLVGQQSKTYQPGQGQAPILDQPGTGLLGGLEQNNPNALRDYYAKAAAFDPQLGVKGLMSLSPSGKDSPSSVREWEYLKKQFPKMPIDFPTYLEVKRQGYTVGNVAGVPSMRPQIPGLPVIPLTTLSKEAHGQATIEGAKTGAKEKAKDTVEAQTNLGSAIDEIDKMRTNVNALLNAPGFKTIYGASGLIDPRNYYPGSDAANAGAMREQLSSQAFGISIQKMRGLGQLSDAEGKKITAAYTRATNPKISDQEARKAWNEVLEGLDLAERRAKEKANVSTGSGSIDRSSERSSREAEALRILRGR